MYKGIPSLKCLDWLELNSQEIIPTRKYEKSKNSKYNHSIAYTLLLDTNKEDG
jgi:hypothetical protein